MRRLGQLLLALAVLTALAAIWEPFGAWWQFLATAVVLLFAGAALTAATDTRRHPIDQPALLPEHIAHELMDTPPDPHDDEDPPRRVFGRGDDQ